MNSLSYQHFIFYFWIKYHFSSVVSFLRRCKNDDERNIKKPGRSLPPVQNSWILGGTTCSLRNLVKVRWFTRKQTEMDVLAWNCINWASTNSTSQRLSIVAKTVESTGLIAVYGTLMQPFFSNFWLQTKESLWRGIISIDVEKSKFRCLSETQSELKPFLW